MAMITEEEENRNNNNNKNNKKKKIRIKIKKSSFVTDKEAIAAARIALDELQEDYKLEAFRIKTMKDLASEDRSLAAGKEEQIKARYLILNSYRYDDNYLKSSWRRYHGWFH